MLSHCVSLLKEEGYAIVNIDCTVVAQKPKLAPHIPTMKQNIASVCGLDPNCVNVKATTEEGLGFTGHGEGMAAQTVCLISRQTPDDLY